MQTDILYKQLITKLDELKMAIERFERHTPPSTAYAEQLHYSINEANKLVSAYVVLKEQKDVSPDLNLHLKVMNVVTSQAEVKKVEKIETQVQPTEVVVTPQAEALKTVVEAKPEPVVEKKPVEIVFEKPELKTYPKLVININDKFRLINELFAGNANEYNIAIEQLNNVSTKEEGQSYLNGLKGIYSWNENHEMLKKLQFLVQQRFI